MTDNRSQGRHCGNCNFWGRVAGHSGYCRRRAPLPGENRNEVAHWPQTFQEDYCGEWRANDGEVAAITLCKQCVYWSFHRRGLTPVDLRDQLSNWWAHAAHCHRHAPKPSETPGHSAHWRATNQDDGCFEGKTRPSDARQSSPGT